MNTIKDIFKVGNGPSSSHTMGPINALKYYIAKYPNPTFVRVTLFGSLALTGKGHLTDLVIDTLLAKIPHEIIFDNETKVSHPNTLKIYSTHQNNISHQEEIISIGGSSIASKDGTRLDTEYLKNVYPHSSLTEILNYCKENSLSLTSYILKHEDTDIRDFAKEIFEVMNDAVARGISKEGLLPGTLNVSRKAKDIYERYKSSSNPDMILPVAAFAVSEENASGGKIVIAPTAGSCGVLPAIMTYLQTKNYPLEDIIDGLLVAGLIGQISKTNGSIAGAEAGCQAEIGVACAMGAAALATCEHLSNEKIAQSAEIALEHSLGLTCDPVGGYVIIPCIERNAMYALKAKDAVSIAKLVPSSSTLVSFDASLKTMLQTGRDLQAGYRETATKGLASELNKLSSKD